MFPGEKRWHRQRWPLGHSGSIRPSPGEASATFASAAASVSLFWAGSGEEAEMRGQRTPRFGWGEWREWQEGGRWTKKPHRRWVHREGEIAGPYSVLKVELTREGWGAHWPPCLPPSLLSFNIRFQPVETWVQSWPPWGLFLPKRSLTFEFPPRAPSLGSKCIALLFLRRMSIF